MNSLKSSPPTDGQQENEKNVVLYLSGRRKRAIHIEKSNHTLLSPHTNSPFLSFRLKSTPLTQCHKISAHTKSFSALPPAPTPQKTLSSLAPVQIPSQTTSYSSIRGWTWSSQNTRSPSPRRRRKPGGTQSFSRSEDSRGTSVATGASWQPNEYAWMIIQFIHPCRVESQQGNG